MLPDPGFETPSLLRGKWAQLYDEDLYLDFQVKKIKKNIKIMNNNDDLAVFLDQDQ